MRRAEENPKKCRAFLFQRVNGKGKISKNTQKNIDIFKENGIIMSAKQQAGYCFYFDSKAVRL